MRFDNLHINERTSEACERVTTEAAEKGRKRNASTFFNISLPTVSWNISCLRFKILLRPVSLNYCYQEPISNRLLLLKDKVSLFQAPG